MLDEVYLYLDDSGPKFRLIIQIKKKELCLSFIDNNQL